MRGVLKNLQDSVPEGEAGVKCLQVCRTVRMVKSLLEYGRGDDGEDDGLLWDVTTLR